MSHFISKKERLRCEKALDELCRISQELGLYETPSKDKPIGTMGLNDT